MPTISRFFGIVISMFFNDHNPPHFHVMYGEFKAVLGIRDFALLEGKLPAKVLGLVVEWAASHQEELLVDWELARQSQQLLPIEPLQ